MIKSATLSPCSRYRYQLGRHWSDRKPLVHWIMLNPSTADAELDDPTIRRCIAFSRTWGYGGMLVTNLFAWRATDPRELRQAVDPVGEFNDMWINRTAKETDLTVCAWGTQGSLHGRDGVVLSSPYLKRAKLTYLCLTRDGHPSHPLYLPSGLTPTSWTRKEIS